MSTPDEDFALLLAAPSATDAKLACNLLEQAGIPTMTHGQDRDFAELGQAVHMSVARPDVFVPKPALARARELLEEAWGKVDWPS